MTIKWLSRQVFPIYWISLMQLTKKEILLNENNEDVTEYEPIVVALPIKPIVKETARDMRQRLRQERL